MPTEAWILATPEGLAVAFRNTQPAVVPRTRQRVQRDFEAQVDRVNVMIDFDGDGRTGYNFRVSSTDDVYDGVITNETQFNKDWDGNWQHAVSEDDDGWTAEMLIPWYIAPMREAKGDKRTSDLSRPRDRHHRRARRVAAGQLRAPALPVRLRGHRSGAVTASRCSRSRRTFPGSTTTSATTATSTPASTSSGSRTARCS